MIGEHWPRTRHARADAGSRPRSLAGRIDEVIYTMDGRAMGRLDPVFKARLPIREAQIVQETLDRVRVRLCPGAGVS